ncbi:MAG: ABC transporter ATP-binding protein/permease [Longimicrobiales bacterium]|nr:ABC transporter ATP-binding protein/permease [Longimicrobiales bacterium]
MSLYPRLVGFVRPHSTTILVAVAAAAIYAVLDATTYVLLIPFVDALFVSGGAPLASSDNGVQRLLDATVYTWVDLTGDPLVAIGRIIVLILSVFLVKNLFAFARVYLLARAEQGVNRDLRDEVYDHLLDLDLAFFGRTRTGQIVSRLTTEIEQFRMLVTREVSRLVSAVFEFLGALAFMLLISWKLTLAAFVVIPVAMGIWGPLVNVLRRRDRRVLQLGGEVNAHIVETLAGVRLVKSSSAEGRERARFHGLTADYFRQFMRAEVARSMAAPMTEMLAAAGTGVILWYGARLVVGADITGAQFVGFLGLSLKLYAPVKNVAKFPAMAQPGLVAAERVFEFLDAKAEITDRPDAGPVEGFDRDIVYDRVTFAYRDGEPVLEDVSFTVPRGSVVALVGPSGAGKSTVVDLLSRFFDVTDGSVSIDGRDVRDLRVTELRSLMGIVSQETVLFHDSVRANIAYGRPDASVEQVEAAARAANAHEFVERMEDGYDTLVGERGVELSGGQRQRIAIARAILRDPPILVFDEATSALDTESERLIQDAIERLLEGRTVFVVAHRLSTVQRADQILVLEGGRIVEQGDHQTLLAQSGRYKRLHDLQFEAAAPITQT